MCPTVVFQHHRGGGHTPCALALGLQANSATRKKVLYQNIHSIWQKEKQLLYNIERRKENLRNKTKDNETEEFCFQPSPAAKPQRSPSE